MKRSRPNPISEKRRAILAERQSLRERILGGHRPCAALIPGICTFRATEVHEILTRARGGSIVDDDNCLGLCRGCHAYITEHPAWADENGFTVHSWASSADLEEARRRRERGRS